jgi:hypothetical protein
MNSLPIIATAALVLSGCASVTVTEPQIPPRAWGSSGGMKSVPINARSEQPSSQMRKVAFSVGKFAPHFSDDAAADHSGEIGSGAGRGALTGVGACAQLLRAGPIGALFAVGCAPFGLVLGGVAGGLNGASTASELNQRAAMSRLQSRANTDVDFHVLAAAELSTYARSQGLELFELAGEGPTNKAELTRYRGADYVVEVVITDVNVVAVAEGMPYQRVEVSARGRLMRADGWILDEIARKESVVLSDDAHEAARQLQGAVASHARAYVDKWILGRADMRKLVQAEAR